MKKIAQIRDQGRSTSGEYIHSEIGSNFRTTDIQSAIGIEQLKKIESFLESRNKIATEYKKNLRDVSFQEIPNYVSKHSFMMFFAIAENQETRNKHLDVLRSNQVDARISWLSLHSQPVNEKFSNNEYPKSENIYNKKLQKMNVCCIKLLETYRKYTNMLKKCSIKKFFKYFVPIKINKSLKEEQKKYKIIGDKTGSNEGIIISLIAVLVNISTHFPYSGFLLPDIIPFILENCLLTSITTAPPALPTACIPIDPNK